LGSGVGFHAPPPRRLVRLLVLPKRVALGVPPRTVMELAGHSALEMTMNVYGHVSLDEKREALDKVGELFEEGL
jgi:integrase